MKDANLVVMIDDDTDDHEIFSMALSEIKAPVNCLFFQDCEHALAHFNEEVNAPGYVFIDLNLPRIDGGECLAKLQKLKEFDHPCIIIYSSGIPVEWQDNLVALGVDKFMEKSGSIPALVEQLKQLLD